MSRGQNSPSAMSSVARERLVGASLMRRMYGNVPVVIAGDDGADGMGKKGGNR